MFYMTDWIGVKGGFKRGKEEMCGLFGSSDCFGHEEARFYRRREVIWINQC